MNLQMTRKKPSTTTTVSATGLEAEIARLVRQNATLKREVAKLQVFRSMAYRDPLTGLWNRRFFEERLREEFSRSRRAGADRRFSVAVVDINGFKEINDDHGHQAGDAMLRWVGDFLSTHLRTHDVPCRTGGDEFMVLLPDLGAADCQLVIARLRQKLTEANEGRAIPVSLSVGTASYPEISESCEKMIDAADGGMYEDKRAQKSARGESPRSAPLTRSGRFRVAG